MISLFQNPSPAAMSLDDIRASIDREEAEAKAEEAERTRDRKALEQARREHNEHVGAARRELAADLGCDPSGLAAVIQVRASKTGETAPIWRMLLAISHAADDVDLVAVREARHVLAAMAEIPAVRKNDQASGPAKAIRDLPRVVRGGNVIDLALEQIAIAAGLAMPTREQPAEPYEVARDRIENQRARGQYNRKDPARNDAIAAREIELVGAERFKFAARAHAAHAKAVDDLREALVAVIDRTLAGLDLGAAWAWTMDLRRNLAGARPRFGADALATFHTATALGARFDFSKVG